MQIAHSSITDSMLVASPASTRRRFVQLSVVSAPSMVDAGHCGTRFVHAALARAALPDEGREPLTNGRRSHVRWLAK